MPQSTERAAKTQPPELPKFRRTADTFTPGAKTLPRQYFVSSEIFDLEREQIFCAQWLCVGHQNQIAGAGDYFIQEIAGESIIICRGQNSVIRGFYNVCRHRGTRMCEEKSGRFSHAIQCPYHGWTYGLDGRLLGAPHMDQVEGFAKQDYPLRWAPLALWEGFIFLNLASRPQPHEVVFAPLSGKFQHWNLSALRSAKRIDYDVRANWKLLFENYSECYHCPLVHPGLSKLTPYDSAENDLCEGPFLGGFMPIIKGGSLTMSGNACALPVGDIKAGDHHRVFYYSIFPNMLLSMHPDYVMVHQLWPQAPDRTLVNCDWLFHPDAFGREDFHPEDAIEFWDMTNKQDWHVCELSQAGIASQSYTPGPYSPRESIPAAWDREYLKALGRAGEKASENAASL